METNLNMIYWKAEKFWVGKLLDRPEIMTQGKTLKELEENITVSHRSHGYSFVSVLTTISTFISVSWSGPTPKGEVEPKPCLKLIDTLPYHVLAQRPVQTQSLFAAPPDRQP